MVLSGLVSVIIEGWPPGPTGAEVMKPKSCSTQQKQKKKLVCIVTSAYTECFPDAEYFQRPNEGLERGFFPTSST